MKTASTKVINGWAMYDWANSVYNLVITTTFFPIYFLAVTNEHVSFLGMKFVNSALYNYTMAAAYLLVAIASPILSSIADTRGNKKNFLRFFTILGALSCSALYFFDSSTLMLGVVCFMLSTVGYCGGLVFYNSYLPEIAAPEDRDRISARGFSMGYIGSVILQLIGFGLVMAGKPLGMDESMPVKITFLLVGVWWLGFALITFARLPDSIATVSQHTGSALTEGFTELRKVYAQVKQMPVLKRFLRGFFFYSMGVQTVMMAATVFGSKVLHLPAQMLIVTVVIIQLVAIAGAWSMARLSDKYGNLRVLIGVVILWAGICIAGYKMQTATHFYMLATAVGLVMGGIQSLSRSTYAKLMPETTDTTSFFSYYDVTEKLSIVIGMFSFAYIDDLTEDMRNSVLALVVFFVIGLIWILSALRKQQQLKPAI
ncbi:UMF1 family MFS transporter [Chitinophaga polysaccharea]|uniref:UMF1 family MFS transporter n=1 Tax=Chitinophaga polysaccharea TaxID=1293035 RepID=A0A561Q1C4_9BACT|nr:MFS transporter [Chitinophaga polysaccharea]TWF44163.1 UMF1 family MFS transporter [Chitinophaga polysaccharea]